ncbi:arf-GAP with SH3 domain, ANK repeat and PH domain-containing protein 1-like [Diadema antillarum]|uniref:arf-GAP with SH3 domain, ANK repeat and PH domain-containing protein 1-like n=1 Tax=Diadema antillarum TaxID=105358 RepID=UPI003A841096
MPDTITVAEFVAEATEDISSPTTSNFVARMGACRNVVSSLEETLDTDRSGLNKMRKSIKAIYQTGNTYVGNLLSFSENLEKLGSSTLTREREPDLGAAFLKFSVVTKELAALLKSLVQNINNIIMFPLDTLLKGDLKGQKGDLKKPFEKAWKDYESKYTKIEREKKQQARDAGLIRQVVSGPEVAEEMEKERRMFQLQMCEYLVKVNEIKAKKGADLVQHLVEYFRAENNYFRDGLKTVEHFQSYIDELSTNVSKIKSRHDEEKRQLSELKTVLKNSLNMDKETPPEKQGYSLHQLQTNNAMGTEKSGYLHKRTEGLRKVYQKRKCEVCDGYLHISHSTPTRAPATLNLLTCQVKPSLEESSRKYFDLVAQDRTYHFMAETEEEAEEWISVLNNSKKFALEAVFNEGSSPSEVASRGLQDLTQSIVKEVKRLPGNNVCCDCTAADPQWLSTNLGILTCIECSGVHREMGVHISRVQSLELDRLSTAQLLLAITVGNEDFNEVYEANLESNKPTQSSSMDVRKEFIRAKYEKKKFVLKTSANPTTLLFDLRQAVLLSEILQVLRVFAEGVDLTSPLPNTPGGKTALHLAVEQQDDVNLHIVDFIIQNTTQTDQQMVDGNTPLHLAAKYNKVESLKLLLRSSASLEILNRAKETPLDIAAKCNFTQCEELLRQATQGKCTQCEHVEFRWGMMGNEEGVDFSDDELESRNLPIKSPRRPNHRPQTLPNSPVGSLPRMSRDRFSDLVPRDQDSADKLHMPPPPVPPRRTASVKKKAPPLPVDLGHKRTSSDPHAFSTQPPTPPTRITSIRDSGKSSEAPSVAPPPIPKSNSHVEQMKQLLAWENRRASYSHSYGYCSRPELLPRPPSMDSPPAIPPKKYLTSDSNGTAGSGSSRPGSQASFHGGSSQPNSRPSSQQDLPSLPTTPGSRSQSRHGSVTDDTSSSGARSGSSSSGPPTPAPRVQKAKRPKRVRALYDCQADYQDELTFEEGENIVVTGEADAEWWIGEIEGNPTRRGVFPVCFVHVISD